MANEFLSTTGKKVCIHTAPFKDVMKLKAAIAKEMAGADFSFDIDMSKGFEAQDFDVASIAKVALMVDSSDEVSEKLFACLVRCTYGGDKITEATFEDEEAREDYYQVVIACLKVNLSPFFKPLISLLSPVLSAGMESMMVGAKKEEKPQK